MAKLPEILSVETVATSQLFRIERLQLRFSNGNEAAFERIPGGKIGAVVVVPLLNDDTVLLIREYAAGLHSYELGLPKGRADPGESLLAAANRELMEEIGYGAHRLELMKPLAIAPNYIGHRTHVVLARDLYPQRLAGDEPEPLETVPWPLHRLSDLIARDDFSEARSLAALFLARERLAMERG